MAETITFEKLYLIENLALIQTAGPLVGAVLTGGLIALTILCLFHLSSDTKGSRGQRIILQTYVITLSPIVLGLQIIYFLLALFPGLSPNENWRAIAFGKIRWPADLLPVIITGMTDALFIWRCYMVQKSPMKHTSAWWQHMFWVFPACLWILSLVTGIIGLVLDDDLSHFRLVSKLQSIMFISNAVINLYTTIFISLRLLLHQQTVARSFGTKRLPARYLYIIYVLLQSAAVNVPIAITTAVGVWLGLGWGLVMIPIAGASQALASVLIIHQVARARNANSQRAETVNLNLIRSGTTSNPEPEKPERAV